MRPSHVLPLLLAILLLSACSTPVAPTDIELPSEPVIIEESEPEQEILDDTRESPRYPAWAGDDHNRFAAGDFCDDGDIVFEHPPVNLDKTELLVPLGLMSGSHVTPVDHQYFQNFDNTAADIEVYSPARGRVSSISHMPGAPEGEDYRMVIDHTCSISSVYIHIHTLSDRLAKVPLREDGHAYPNIEVEEGEVIGYYSTNVDYNLIDTSAILEGFVVPEHYEGEPWKRYVPETIPYFSPDIQEDLTDMSIRMYEPISGKLDHDIDGKLQGSWFLEGTQGYAGTGQDVYWRGHLSISPNHLVPDHFIVSLGDFGGTEAQYGVKSNGPHPANIDASDGPVRYELVDYEYYTDTGERWDRRTRAKIKEVRNMDDVKGTILLEMIGDRKLRAEVFVGQDADQVQGFTAAARTYER